MELGKDVIQLEDGSLQSLIDGTFISPDQNPPADPQNVDNTQTPAPDQNPPADPQNADNTQTPAPDQNPPADPQNADNTQTPAPDQNPAGDPNVASAEQVAAQDLADMNTLFKNSSGQDIDPNLSAAIANEIQAGQIDPIALAQVLKEISTDSINYAEIAQIAHSSPELQAVLIGLVPALANITDL